MSMRRSVVVSCSLHAAVFALAYYGLPELRHPAPMIDTPITVDIVTVADKTNAPPPAPKPEVKPEPKPEPKPVAVPPPPEPKPEPKPKPKPEPKPEPKAEPKPVPKPAAPEPLAQAKPQRKPKPPDTFASVLKTVEELKKQAPRTKPEETKKKPEKQPEPKETFENQIAKALRSPPRSFNASQPLTISEIDLVRQQIARCWNLPAGAKDAEDLSIEIHTVMNPDGTVREARIQNQTRMQRDPFFRAAAESALRAVLNPRCSPLKLPPEKYDQWKDMTLNFNPKDMF
jgi:outer membrane biosynthesis protein TonB